MNRSAVTRFARYGGLALADLPPSYLAPSLVAMNQSQSSSFSTTPVAAGRARGRDLSKNRGVSAIHRTGPKFKLTAAKYPLPVPVPRSEFPEPAKTPNHGLWAFFPKNREALSNPETDGEHGRAWAITELRDKSWDDLHRLWWVCLRERNRIATSNYERTRLAAGYGEHEAEARDKVIRTTMRAIKHVLRERWYAWEEATRLYEKGVRPDTDEMLEL